MLSSLTGIISYICINCQSSNIESVDHVGVPFFPVACVVQDVVESLCCHVLAHDSHLRGKTDIVSLTLSNLKKFSIAVEYKVCSSSPVVFPSGADVIKCWQIFNAFCYRADEKWKHFTVLTKASYRLYIDLFISLSLKALLSVWLSHVRSQRVEVDTANSEYLQ